MRAGGTGLHGRRSEPRAGLLESLRRPPGGRPARIMLTAQFLDRTGTGVWNAAAVLYFTVEARLDAHSIGLLIGVAGAAGVLGSPLAGRLAANLPLRTLLIGCHLLRLCTLLIILSTTSFAVLLPVVALTMLGDRAAKTLEMLFATAIAGPERATYQALFRSAANAGIAMGAGVAAIGLAVGTRDAYRILILLDALSFIAAAALVRRVPTAVSASAAIRPSSASRRDSPHHTRSPWHDKSYLRFVLVDILMTTDDSVLNVGLPLWLLTRTKAPHLMVPLFLVINTVLVVALQMRVSAATKGPRDATTAVARYGSIMLACCVVLALAPELDGWGASLALIAAAFLVTFAELMRSVSSWELAVSLAPDDARPAYLGVAGISQSIQKCAGPLVLTGAVLAAGPVGWLVLGGVVAAASGGQRRGCLRTLDRLAAYRSLHSQRTGQDVEAQGVLNSVLTPGSP